MPEWHAVEGALTRSKARAPADWNVLAQCAAIVAYTDGSAPVRNPGGQAGFSAIVVGWKHAGSVPTDLTEDPDTRIDIGGYITGRETAPQTSNNRAEIAGILAAVAAIGLLPVAVRCSTIWSDSDYGINCATGHYKRKKNLDLWAVYDTVFAQTLLQNSGGGIELRWVKGHAGNAFNEAADELATRAAFDFDDASYRRFRTLQAATGMEMPRIAQLPADNNAESAAQPGSKGSAMLDGWQSSADYLIVLCTHIDGNGQPSVGCGPASGQYQLWTRTGKCDRADVSHTGNRAAAEAEYLTLLAALDDLLARITCKGAVPGKFRLLIYSRTDLLVKQLSGVYRVRSATLQPHASAARSRLDRFGSAELVWKQSHIITRLFS